MRLVFFLSIACCFRSAFPSSNTPWLGEFLELNLINGYTLGHYSAVADGTRGYASTDHTLYSGLSMRFHPEYEGGVEAAFQSTRHRSSLHFQSMVAHLRYLYLNAFSGDPLDMVFMGSVRYVPTDVLQDPSAPYHGQFNVEVGASLGKEMTINGCWSHSPYLYALIGQANKGLPWLTLGAVYEVDYQFQHDIGIAMMSYIGLGDKEEVPIAHFDGYGNIAHRSIDIGVYYRRNFAVWGALRLEYSRRVLAARFPKNENRFMISYTLPFSFL